MKVVEFSLYYLKLKFSVAFGLYRTSLPMDINWRWRFWQQRHYAQHRLH